MDEPKWSISDDGRTLVLDIPSKPLPSHFALDVAGVENMLRILIEARMQLQPEIPQEDPAPGSQFISAPHMRWAPGVDSDGRMAICIMHPGIGWIAMPMSPEQWRDFQQKTAAFAARLAPLQSDGGSA